MRPVIVLTYLSIFLGISSCRKPTNKFTDAAISSIADFQDRRQTDSLIKQLLNTNVVYRVEAAKALASVQDSTAALQLGTMLLEDPIDDARLAAAFALGQTKSVASVNALIPALEDRNSAVVATVLEALGKTVEQRDLNSLVRFTPKDSIQQAGQAWGFYAVGLRGLADTNVVKKQLHYLLPRHSNETRLAAAHFFSRATKIKIESGEELIEAASHDRSAYVRMAATNSLRKLDSLKSIATLVSILKNENDYRVRVSAVRALTTWSSDQTWPGILHALNDANEHVGVAAAEALKPQREFKSQLEEVAKSTNSFRVRGNIYRALLKIDNDTILINKIIESGRASRNEYEKATLIGALVNSPIAFKFVADELLNATSFVVKTTAAQTLADMTEDSKFDQQLKSATIDVYKKAILAGDAGVIGILASALTNPKAGYKNEIVDFDFLRAAKSRLTLPRDIEALQPLEEAIAFFEGRENPKALRNEFNHPINWDLVRSIKTNQQVKVETTRGTIVLQLLVEEAPGSVANFVDLIQKKYYDGKYFHRVVPNFVIQTGCHRGDGFGSEDYSIRSEFSSRKYKEGSVGLASAGKDTEGTQCFITHSPMPHLNGRYTIFAEVVSGIEAVHAIQVGDKITSVSLL